MNTRPPLSRLRERGTAPIPLSPNGPRLSPIVAGVWRIRDWNFDVPARLRWIEQALDLGITSFDNADIYGDYQAETLFGEALAAAPALRRRMQLVTKCGIKLISAQRPAHRIKTYDSSHAHVIASVENSLRALRTDQIDLLLLHRPDFLMDADQLAHTLHVLIEAGKVLHVGVSNYTPSQFALLNQRIPLATRSSCHRSRWACSETARWTSARRSAAGRWDGRRWPAAACSATAMNAHAACAACSRSSRQPTASARRRSPTRGSGGTRHGRCRSPVRGAARRCARRSRHCRST
jgi:Aldo/keto reductase family